MKKYLLIAALSLAAACQPQPGTPTQNTTESTPPAQNVPPATAPAADKAPTSGGDVLATLNGKNITDAEVTARIKDRLQKIESQIYEIKKSGLDDLVEEKLIEAEAAKRRVSVDDLMSAEVEKKIEEPTSSEIETLYNVYKKSKFKDKPLADVKGDIVKQLKVSKKAGAYSKFIAGLKKDADLKIKMERPRIKVPMDGDPSKGNPKAPITIVEFSDFQCPFCKKARGTIDQIMETYKDQVYYVFRDFPLSFHKQAKKASEAAECAGDQKKYWEYSDKLWENQSNLDMDSLKKYSKEIGLNEKKFEECLSSGKFADEVDKDQQEGSKVGVSGTPAYFVNGIFVSGAQPFERFQEIIEEELANAK